MTATAAPLVSRKAMLETAASKPPALAVDPAGIPADLADRPQWVGWRYIQRDGHWTKMPLNPASRRPAKSNDQRTWGTLATALKTPGCDGVGYVFAPLDPFCGIDLDDCRDPATGRLDAWAEELIAEFDSYAEVSPSGTGVKLFVRAALPGGQGRKKGKIEAYDQGRFFAVTGQSAGEPKPVAERQSRLDELLPILFPPTGVGASARPGSPACPANASMLANVDPLVTELLKNTRFRELWTGGGPYPSASEGDLVLCGWLTRATDGDESTVDRLFRQSGRMRAKWDQRRGAYTYGQRTIQRAILGDIGPDVEIERSLNVLWASDVTAQRLDWLWEPWLARGILAVLDGDPGLGKSSITMDLIARATTGRPMPNGIAFAQPTTCLIVACEDSLERVVRPRLEAAGADLTKVALLGGVIESGPDGEQTAALQLPRDMRLVAEECRKLKPALVVIDPLFAVLGVDERGRLVKANDDQSVRRLTQAFTNLAEETGTTILAVRHLNKTAGGSALMRGSGSIAIAGQARAVLLAAKDPEDPERSRVLAMTKSNLGPLPRSRRFTLTAVETSVGKASRAEWGLECDISADDLVKPPDGKRVEKRDHAEEFLREALAQGEREWADLVAAAGVAGLGHGALRSARERLNLRQRKRGKHAVYWRLPDPFELAPLPLR